MEDLTPKSGRSQSSSTIDYDSPVKVKHMRSIFSYLGTVWNDLGKPDTDLNLMLSSPLFRHEMDANAAKLSEELGKSSEAGSEDKDAMKRVLSENQTDDESLLSMWRLVLFAVLYCKGSRIGKSGLLYPLLSR